MHNVCLFVGVLFLPASLDSSVLCRASNREKKRHLDSQKASNRCCINDDSSIRLTNDLATDIYREVEEREP